MFFKKSVILVIYHKSIIIHSKTNFLVNEGRSSSRFVLPGWWENTGGSVVSGKTVDSGFDQNKSELGVLVLSVLFQVLSDRNSLLDKVVKIFWDFRSDTYNNNEKNATLSAQHIPYFEIYNITKQRYNRSFAFNVEGGN